MTNDEIDWKQIQKDYVLGITDDNGIKKFPSYDDLATKYKVSSGTLRNVGGPEKWSQQRKNRKLKVTRKAIQKKSHKAEIIAAGIDPKDVEEASNYDAELIVASDETYEKRGEKLGLLCELTIDNLTASIKKGGYVKAYELKMIGEALKSSFEVVKLAQGELAPGNGDVVNGNKYEFTQNLIGSNEHIDHEMGILNAVNEKQTEGE